LRAAKLKEVIERHLPYEIAGLFRFFQILTDGVPVSGLPGQLIHTALVEAFCIHARVLHDFLTNRPGTGVHAKHATHGYKPFANGSIDRKITNKLHDHVAHLTLRRTVKLEEYIGAKERSGKIARRGAEVSMPKSACGMSADDPKQTSRNSIQLYQHRTATRADVASFPKT
jgi:hypothetical protein